MNSNFAVIVEDLSVLKTTWKREKCSSSYIPFCFTFLSKPCKPDILCCDFYMFPETGSQNRGG